MSVYNDRRTSLRRQCNVNFAHSYCRNPRGLPKSYCAKLNHTNVLQRMSSPTWRIGNDTLFSFLLSNAGVLPLLTRNLKNESFICFTIAKDLYISWFWFDLVEALIGKLLRGGLRFVERQNRFDLVVKS